MPELDDYLIDIEFGEWISSQRRKRKISIGEVSTLTGIPLPRFKSLEMGVSEKGITEREINFLAKLYKIDAHLIKSKALGSKE